GTEPGGALSLSSRALPGYTTGEPCPAGGLSEVHGTRRRVDGISFCRFCVDPLGRSPELGLVPQRIPGRGGVPVQHLAADVGGVARGGARATRYASFAGDL